MYCFLDFYQEYVFLNNTCALKSLPDKHFDKKMTQLLRNADKAGKSGIELCSSNFLTKFMKRKAILMGLGILSQVTVMAQTNRHNNLEHRSIYGK